MTGARGTDVRFQEMVDRRLLPGLDKLGFTGRPPRALASAERDGGRVTWLVDLHVAPWSAPDRWCFTMGWGVHVAGVEGALGDPVPDVLGLDSCLVTGSMGRGPGREMQWFEVRTMLKPLVQLADLSVANHVLCAVDAHVLPALGRLGTVADVQHHLAGRLGSVRGAASGEELRTIRHVAALSMVLGDRANAARWLDHLEVRSRVTMAPDLVAERLAPIRERLAS